MFTINSQLPYFTANNEQIKVDKIIQEAVLDVNEAGTVAAAATNAAVLPLSIKDVPEEVYVQIDQPFISIILDKRNKIPLFISKIYNP